MGCQQEIAVRGPCRQKSSQGISFEVTSQQQPTATRFDCQHETLFVVGDSNGRRPWWRVQHPGDAVMIEDDSVAGGSPLHWHPPPPKRLQQSLRGG